MPSDFYGSEYYTVGGRAGGCAHRPAREGRLAESQEAGCSGGVAGSGGVVGTDGLDGVDRLRRPPRGRGAGFSLASVTR